MTEVQLADIRARVIAATDGPWLAKNVKTGPWWIETAARDAQKPSEPAAYIGQYGHVLAADAVFCAHAREDIPVLLVEVSRLRALLAMTRVATIEEAARLAESEGINAPNDAYEIACDTVAGRIRGLTERD